MRLLQKILQRLSGLHYSQEYLCLAKESMKDPLYLYLISGKKIIKDITNLHCFVGYKPLLFAIPLLQEMPREESAEIQLCLTDKPVSVNSTVQTKKALAHFSLKRTTSSFSQTNNILIYEGIRVRHRFISTFSRFIIRLNNRLFNTKAGNVYLPGNLYEQVQTAYSLPRTISLVTVCDNGFCNLFPTDLHGAITEQYYMMSLRYEGKACKQVEKTKKICISEIAADHYKFAYSLGKNHMQDMKTKGDLPFSELVTSSLLPLPPSVLMYRELELIDTLQQGIHKLLLFKTLAKHQASSDSATLSHVHNVYATWRFNKGLKGNYLLR